MEYCAAQPSSPGEEGTNGAMAHRCGSLTEGEGKWKASYESEWSSCVRWDVLQSSAAVPCSTTFPVSETKIAHRIGPIATEISESARARLRRLTSLLIAGWVEDPPVWVAASRSAVVADLVEVPEAAPPLAAEAALPLAAVQALEEALRAGAVQAPVVVALAREEAAA
jgi:hypothetical protein